MKIKRDQITGLFLVVLGAVVAVLVSQFKTPMTAAYPGPRLFPLISAFGFIVCGIGIFFTSTFSNKAEKVFLVKKGWMKVLLLFALLCVYVLMMKYLGYLIVTPFVLFAFSTIIAKDGKSSPKVLYRVIFSVGFTLLIYLMYVNVFGLALPAGLLFE